MQFDQLKRREFITLLGGGRCVAARGARAAGGDAGGLPQWSVGRGMGQLDRCVSQRFERKRLYGGRQLEKSGPGFSAARAVERVAAIEEGVSIGWRSLQSKHPKASLPGVTS